VDAPLVEFVFRCPAEEISAYIDGELSRDVEDALERHVGSCRICRRELNHQKGFLLALSDTLEREIQVELPEDFTRSVVANAESKVSGLRDRGERSVALIVGGSLLVLATLAVGGVAGVFSPLRSLFEKLFALVGMAIQVLGDLLYAIAAMARSLLQTQNFSPALAYISLSLAIAILLYLGSRSLRRYFRSSGT